MTEILSTIEIFLIPNVFSIIYSYKYQLEKINTNLYFYSYNCCFEKDLFLNKYFEYKPITKDDIKREYIKFSQ